MTERNFPTQSAILWIDTDEETHKRYIELARRAADADELAEQIEKAIQQEAPEGSGLYTDLLEYALQEIDYNAIAAGLLEELEG
jgi:hypothetical protein